MHRTTTFVRRACAVLLSCIMAGVLFASSANAQPLVPPIDLGQIQNQLQDQFGGALSQIPTIPELLDQVIPEPEFEPLPSGEVLPPVAALAPEDQLDSDLVAVQDIRAAMMPSDVRDSFFNDYPVNLAEFANGQVIESRNITATAALLVGAPVERVIQVKFRSNDASGQPSFGTASLVIPATPWSGDGKRCVAKNGCHRLYSAGDCMGGQSRLCRVDS